MANNLTAIVAGNETSMLTFIQGVNTELMAGWLGVLFLIGISLVLFISFIFKFEDFMKALSATSFISFTLALGLIAIDLLPNLALFIPLIGAAISIAFSWRG